MTILDPNAALRTCEVALRSIMELVYPQHYGNDWLRDISNSKQRRDWKNRANEAAEDLAARAVASVPDAGLAYSHMRDLVEIASKHWAPLVPALGDEAVMVPMLAQFESLRNIVAHHRPLVPYEQELYSGIAGMIRNKVTAHVSQQDPSGDIYPRIESASDEFGRVVDIITPTTERAGYVSTGKSIDNYYITVRPGDVVRFTVSAVDPQDRDIHWSLIYPMGYHEHTVVPSGTETVLTWTVNEGDVQDSAAVNIHMEADGARYHRAGQFDQWVCFMFRVLPPID